MGNFDEVAYNVTFREKGIIDVSRAYPTTFEDVRRSRLWQTRVMESLSLLERWYSAQCDGDWEHQYGVHIGTLDNPGWTLRIDLCGTDVEGRTLDRVKLLYPCSSPYFGIEMREEIQAFQLGSNFHSKSIRTDVEKNAATFY
jgi:Immunity protein 53